MREKTSKLKIDLKGAKEGKNESLLNLYNTYYHYVTRHLNEWDEEDTKEYVELAYEERLFDSINSYIGDKSISKASNYISHKMIRLSEIFSDKLTGYTYLCRNYPLCIEEVQPKIMPMVRNYIFSELDKKGITDDTYRYKLLYVAALEIESCLSSDSRVSIKTILKNMLKNISVKKIVFLYNQHMDIQNKEDVKDAYSYYVDTYTDSYKGMLDRNTVRRMYADKLDSLVDRLDEENIDKMNLPHYIGSNFNQYQFTVRGFERKELSRALKRIDELVRKYEKRRTEEEKEELRKIYFKLALNYVENDSELDLDSYIIKSIMDYDLEAAIKLKKELKQYKDDYEIRNVLVK